jgi:hypothetical protein
MTRYPLFTEVVLTKDIPESGLKKGDIATIVDFHPAKEGEAGYTVEVFNALGETVDVVTVPESALRLFRTDDMPAVRSMESSIHAQPYPAETRPEYKSANDG